MIDFELSDDQRVLQKSERELCERLIVQQARSWDEEERFPHEVIKPMGEMGLFGMQVPEKYGGAGMKFHDYVIALEEIARADASVGLTMASHNSLCTGHIMLAGNEAQKQKYVPRLATGVVLGGWGLTEPGSGSDAGGMRTTAVRDGSHYVLNGSKNFITNGGIADTAVVMAVTDAAAGKKGISAIVVERGTKGFRSGRKEDKLGVRSSDTSELFFEDCQVPTENLLGVPGMGFIDTLRLLDKGRIGIAAFSLGIAQAARWSWA